jgi:hypothetical protein
MPTSPKCVCCNDSTNLVKCVIDICQHLLCSTHAAESEVGRCPVHSFKGKVAMFNHPDIWTETPVGR